MNLMKLIQKEKKIMELFKPDNFAWVAGEIGAPPFEVSGVA